MEPIVAEIAVISGRGLGGDLGGAAGGDAALLLNGGPRLCPGNLRSVPYHLFCMAYVVNTTSNAIFAMSIIGIIPLRLFLLHQTHLIMFPFSMILIILSLLSR